VNSTVRRPFHLFFIRITPHFAHNNSNQSQTSHIDPTFHLTYNNLNNNKTHKFTTTTTAPSKMKTLTFLSLTTTALAAALSPPVTPPADCKFGTYRCTTPNTGIEICNVLNKWELVGPCPSGTACENLAQNGFTLPRNGRPGQSPGERCTEPGRYDCFGPYAVQVCNVQGVLEFVGSCPQKSHCEYLGGLPFCVESV
jgi:hypothetical protein